ncbi:hypothetical protein EON66_05975 [archaeon]|nr:MAG: hypothetical protein EON66_05975 [archaeon]
MASLLGLCGGLSLASCAVSSACTCVRACCCSMSAASRFSARAAKVFYIGIIAVSAIFALVLYNYGEKIEFLTKLPVIRDVCTNQGSTTSQCFGASAVLRISLALTVFFALNLFTVFSATTFVGLWGVKVLVWIALVVGSFFIPATSIVPYGEVRARIRLCARAHAVGVHRNDARACVHGCARLCRRRALRLSSSCWPWSSFWLTLGTTCKRS